MPREHGNPLRRLWPAVVLATACSAQVSDLDDLMVDDDACDPRGTAVRGTDLDLQLRDMDPHINQQMFFAITVGDAREMDAMAIVQTLDDTDLRLRVPNMLPAGTSELAFWADMMPFGTFNPINDDGDPIDHQWTRPVCPNGKLTFNHTTPFQDVEGAIATRATFEFVLPAALRVPSLLRKYTMWLTVTELDVDDRDTEVQTRGYYRWAPFVQVTEDDPLPEGDDAPEARKAREGVFRIGGVLGEKGGTIDQGSFYNIKFVIDVDRSGDLSGDDYVCLFRKQRAPDGVLWRFTPELGGCDSPRDFDLSRFR